MHFLLLVCSSQIRQNMSGVSDLGVEQTVRVELESGKKYYMRVGVQTKNPSNAYNYTEVAEITVP